MDICESCKGTGANSPDCNDENDELCGGCGVHDCPGCEVCALLEP